MASCYVLFRRRDEREQYEVRLEVKCWTGEMWGGSSFSTATTS